MDLCEISRNQILAPLYQPPRLFSLNPVRAVRRSTKTKLDQKTAPLDYLTESF